MHETSVANKILDRAYRYMGGLDKFAFDAVTAIDGMQYRMILIYIPLTFPCYNGV
jgi:hypothetical protein